MASRTQNRPTVAASGLSATDLLKALQAAVSGGDTLPPGEGWKVAAEYASEWGVNDGQARNLLRAGVEKGIVEKFQGKKNGKAIGFFRPVSQP